MLRLLGVFALKLAAGCVAREVDDDGALEWALELDRRARLGMSMRMDMCMGGAYESVWAMGQTRFENSGLDGS